MSNISPSATPAPTPRYPPAIMATCCVPWNGDCSFAEDVFRRNVRVLLERLTPHLYVFGTAGEGYMRHLNLPN